MAGNSYSVWANSGLPLSQGYEQPKLREDRSLSSGQRLRCAARL